MNTVPTGSGSATLIVRLNKLALDPDPFMQIISGPIGSRFTTLLQEVPVFIPIWPNLVSRLSELLSVLLFLRVRSPVFFSLLLSYIPWGLEIYNLYIFQKLYQC